MASRYQSAMVNQLNPGEARTRTKVAPTLSPSAQDEPRVGPVSPVVAEDRPNTGDWRDVLPDVGGGVAGGVMNPNDMVLDPAPAGGPVDFQKLFMEAAGKQQYGQGGYAALEKELGQHGIQFQKNSAGQFRGRIKLPSGEIVDTALNEGNDNAFLGGQGGTTGAFGWMNRGKEGLDAGGWSFGGGASAPARSAAPLSMPQSVQAAGITPDLAGYTQGSPYIQALIQALGQA